MNTAATTIKMPNNLIFAPQDYEKLERRLLYFCLEEIRERQHPTQAFVSPGQFQLDLFGGNQISESDPGSLNLETVHDLELRTINIPFEKVKSYGSWDLYKKALKSFIKRGITYKHIDGSDKNKSFEETINIVERAKTYRGGGVRIVLSNPGYELLTHLSSSYSKIPLEQALKLTSKYSQRLYEILLARCFGGMTGTWKVEVEKFKELLGIPEEKYNHWGSLEKITLLKAQEEFNKTDTEGNHLSPLTFEYKTIKKSRKVVAIEFDVWLPSSSPRQLHIPGALGEGLTEQQQNAIAYLKEINVAEKHHMTIALKYEKEFWKWKFDRSMNKGKVTNPAGHLLKCLGLV